MPSPVIQQSIIRFLPSTVLLVVVLLLTSFLDFSSISSPFIFSSSPASFAAVAARTIPPAEAPSGNHSAADEKAIPHESFSDLTAAFRQWDEEVGCARFREKHANWTAVASGSQDVDAGECSELGAQHVSVLVKRWRWIPDEMDNLYTCRCGLTCLFTKSEVLADMPDAVFYEGYKPNRTREKGEPLIIFLDIEASRRRTGLEDIFVGYHAKDDVQCTYAASLFRKFRNYLISNQKRNDAIVYWSSSRCFKFRNELAEKFFAHISHHSFGRCVNNMGGGDSALSLYPECTMPTVKEQHWWEHLHCAMSHYKFVLAIENHKIDSYITEKLFYPLQAGSVPIYFGAPDVAGFVPPHSMIDGSKFASMEELAAYVKSVAEDPVAYAEYHAWRRCGLLGHYGKSQATGLDAMPCRVCEEVSRRGGRDAA